MKYASIEAAMMFGPLATPVYSPLPRSPPISGGAIRTVTAPTVSGPLPQRMDVVGQEPGMTGQDPGECLVDCAVERIDRADPIGGRSPFVIARRDDHGAAAADVAAGRGGPAGEMQGVAGRLGHGVTSVGSLWRREPPVASRHPGSGPW